MKNFFILAGVALVGYWAYKKFKKPCGCQDTSTVATINADHTIPPAAQQTPPGTMMYNAKGVGGVWPAQTQVSTVSDNQLSNLTL